MFIQIIGDDQNPCTIMTGILFGSYGSIMNNPDPASVGFNSEVVAASRERRNDGWSSRNAKGMEVSVWSGTLV
tara:strand:+ start:295 stop:513 length:219 start_codon:yes stop_codon:yes gene_type:complete